MNDVKPAVQGQSDSESIFKMAKGSCAVPGFLFDKNVRALCAHDDPLLVGRNDDSAVR